MRVILGILLVGALALIVAIAFGIVDISQTRDAKAPELVVEEGQMPAFDVETPEVQVGTRNATVDVPTVDVGTKEERIELPTVDVKTAEEKQNK